MTIIVSQPCAKRASGDNRPTIEPSRAVALAKMLEAGRKHLPDYSPEQLQAWAERTVDAYIRRGLIIVEAR